MKCVRCQNVLHEKDFEEVVQHGNTLNFFNPFLLCSYSVSILHFVMIDNFFAYTVKLGNNELFDKEQIGIKEPFPVTKCQTFGIYEQF